MNTTLLFDFSIDRENKEIHVQREFVASLKLIWDAWTKPEMLDEWWAPKPYKTRTKSMDFRVGGSWIYSMVSPENTQWCKIEFKKIEVRKSFVVLNGFCNEDGVINPESPLMEWNNSFSERGGITLLDVVIRFENISDLEKIVAWGFKEGFTKALGNLDEYLEDQSK